MLQNTLGAPPRLLTRQPLLVLCALALLLAGAAPAYAQLQVQVKLDRVQHIVQEQMTATVTITNRSGADFVLGGPKGGKWLLFEISDEAGHAISAIHSDDSPPVAFAAGASLSKSVKITGRNMLEQGNYSIKGSVYHSPSGQFYESNRSVFQVQEGMAFCKRLTYGVPEGMVDAGRTRSYALLTHQDCKSSYLYIRIIDEKTGSFLKTFQLGNLTMFRDPQYTLDRGNNLHVMFMTAPNIHRYCVVRPDGSLGSQDTYREGDGGPPKLFLNGANEVVVQGGSRYDPAAERAAMAAQKGKGISEKPPGL